MSTTCAEIEDARDRFTCGHKNGLCPMSHMTPLFTVSLAFIGRGKTRLCMECNLVYFDFLRGWHTTNEGYFVLAYFDKI